MEVADRGELESRGKEKRPAPTAAIDARDEPTLEVTAQGQNNDDYQSENMDEEDDGDEDEDEDEDEDDEDEDEEPQLKYGSLTKSVGGLYRNGDATSASLLSGDKMVCSTTYPGSIFYFSS